jgi:hypothetical protein
MHLPLYTRLEEYLPFVARLLRSSVHLEAFAGRQLVRARMSWTSIKYAHELGNNRDRTATSRTVPARTCPHKRQASLNV